MSFTPIEKVQDIAKLWNTQLYIENKYHNENVKLSFKDIGAETELLSISYSDGFIGGGSGGMGFDLLNSSTKKANEIKSCCTFQNVKCKKCGIKYNNHFNHKCPNCGSNDYVEFHDSRFGINAEEFINQYNSKLFNEFFMWHLSLKDINEETGNILFNLLGYKISFNDEEILNHQLEYFLNQKNKSKSNHCNLLPNSFDFYKLCPEMIDSFFIKLNYKNENFTPEVVKGEINKLRINESIMKKSELDSFRKLKSYNEITKDADVKDFTINIPYRIKNFNKDRGNTRTKLYENLKEVSV